MRRFYWATRTAASMVGVLFGGQPLDVTVSDCQRMTRSAHGGNWYLMDPQASGGGFLMETGSHLIDQALTVTRAAGVNVSAARQSVLNGIDYESLATAKGCSTDGGELSYHILVSRLQDMWSGITISSHSLRLEVPLVPGTPLILTNSVNGAQCVIEAPLKGGLDLIGSYSEQLVRFGRRVRQSDVGSNDQETGVLTTKVLSECYSQSRRCLAGECK
jgi:predicted dehydrogenase